MAVVSVRCGHAMPLWAVAFCAVALSAPQGTTPFLMTLLAVSVIASTMPALMQRFAPARRRVEVLPPWDDGLAAAEIVITARTRTRTLDEATVVRAMKRAEAADLMRMDDDGGWQIPQSADAGTESEAPRRSAGAMIPGAREPGLLTLFAVPAAHISTVSNGPSTMDAVTTAERQREGGGAPSQRRPVRGRVQRTGARGRLHDLLLAIRALFIWRLRTTHV